MSDTEDHNAVSDNDASETLTKPKKQRSEKQVAATERMRAALAAKQKPSLDAAAAKRDVKGKKEILKALKNKLNSAKEPLDVEEESDNESVEEPIQVAPKKIKKVPAVSAATHKNEPVKPKKKPKVIEESETESEEEVIVIKKKKKPKKKKTIIYESATESEEDEEPAQKPVRKERETKTQQNAASKFKVTPGVADSKPKGPIYYFA
jgi:hypothetical protein